MIPVLAGAALAAAAAYGTACRLSGENLLATLADELRLKRADPLALDAACAANPRDSGVVVSLTSIPSRLEMLRPTLLSLLRQSWRPREIRLCLPRWSRREQRDYPRPPWLEELRCVTRVDCEDEGPATKFLPTLRSVGPGQPVLVVDDDRVYHPRLLEHLSRLAKEHPGEIVSAAGWSAPPDLVDRPTTLLARLSGAPYVPVRGNQMRRPRRVDIVQGVHGYVVRPAFFDLEALGDFPAAPPALRYVDDVWLSAHARVPRVVHPLPLAYTDYLPWRSRRLHDATSLGRNVNRAADFAQRGNSVALRHFADRWGRP